MDKQNTAIAVARLDERLTAHILNTVDLGKMRDDALKLAVLEQDRRYEDVQTRFVTVATHKEVADDLTGLKALLEEKFTTRDREGILLTARYDKFSTDLEKIRDEYVNDEQHEDLIGDIEKLEDRIIQMERVAITTDQSDKDLALIRASMSRYEESSIEHFGTIDQFMANIRGRFVVLSGLVAVAAATVGALAGHLVK